MKYLEIRLIEKKDRTNVYGVFSKSSGHMLAEIKWYPSWRTYCLFPMSATVWSFDCLENMVNFIKQEMDKRKVKGKETNMDLKTEKREYQKEDIYGNL